MMEKLDYERDHLERLRPYLPECTVLLKHEDEFRVKEPCPVALYGNGVRHTQKGGTGSGDVNSRHFSTFEEAFETEGFSVTTKSWLDSYDSLIPAARKAFGKRVRQEARKAKRFYLLYGMGMVMEEFSWDMPLESEGELAVYILSRVSGEGNDRKNVPGDYLLTESETKAILELNRRYNKFLLALNVGGPVDLTPVMEVRNILLLSQLGVETAETLVDIILGRSNPSGKLATTWRRVEDDPTKDNFAKWEDTYYREGILVGYRYFDTIGKAPLFPFGFGLSFTRFTQGETRVTTEGTKIVVEAKIKNTGKEKGKETLQLYVSSPSSKLEQPYQTLAAFSKSKELEENEEENLSLSFLMEDLATYSAEDSAYILEKGEYVLRLGTSSRDTRPIGVVALSRDHVVKKVRPLFPLGALDELSIPKKTETLSQDIPHISVDEEAFLSKETIYDGTEPKDPLVSSLSEEELVWLSVGGYKEAKGLESVVGEASTKLCGAAGETTTKLEKKGIPSLVMADGPAGIRISRDVWEDKKGFHTIGGTLFPEMRDLMDPFLGTILRLFDGKPGKKDRVYHQYTTAIPIGTALAQSFNVEFLKRCGEVVGEEMEHFGIDLWLAPALNIHRSPLCGRNFEYYSEDPLLSGLVAAAITNGVQSKVGRGVTIKHFAANNQETNRYNSNSIVSERALRDIYLKSFEVCLRNSSPVAVMTSYNLLGGTHTSESKALVEDVLRKEMGFEGLVMTDWVVSVMDSGKNDKYQTPKATGVAKAGNDLFMPGSRREVEDLQASLQKGTLSREELERNVSRILKVMRRLGRL